MSKSRAILQRFSGGGATYEKDRTLTAGASAGISESIPDSSTDLQIPFPIDISALSAIWIMATGGVITIETNDGSSPDDTLTLADGVPQLWVSTDLATNFLTADVTDLFVTNSSGGAVQLVVETLYDPTP